MIAVILAGGLGNRISEETHLRPKPMIEIGGKPILWHIMKSYSAHGVNNFVICCGYKGYLIKEYFANYFRTLLMSLSICRTTRWKCISAKRTLACNLGRHWRRNYDWWAFEACRGLCEE